METGNKRRPCEPLDSGKLSPNVQLHETEDGRKERQTPNYDVLQH